MIRWLFLALALPVAALAQDYPERIDPHVNDFAEVLSPAEEAGLRDQAVVLQGETGVEVVIVTVSARADFGDPLTVEDWATGLFNTWEIGTAERDDGILILVGIDDREMRLALGSGYGPEFDAEAQRVVDNAIVPAFREAAYAQGLAAGLKALRPRIIDPFLAGNPPPALEPAPFPWVPAGIFGAFVAVLMAIGGRRLIGDAFVRFQACPQCGQKTLQRTRTVVTRPTIHTAGRESTLTTCRSCTYRNETERTLRKKSTKKSSGSSGGGRSSGGGATGRW